jgi:IclR family transcriptional regulator, acetate operon repressor
MHDDRRSPTLIQSVQRALHLVEAVAATQGRAQAKELARTVGLPLSTAYHLLRTLTHEGYLRRLDDGSYVLGPSLTQVASQNAMASVLARARPSMQALRDDLKCPVYLALFHDGEIAVVEIVDSPRIPSIDLWVGIHDSAHATALGKCILGVLDDDLRRDYLERHPLHQLTRRTVTDRRTLEDEIGHSAEVARDDEEYSVGVHCLAAPVVTAGVIGAVAVARRGGRPASAVDVRVTRTLVSGAERIGRSFGLPTSA